MQALVKINNDGRQTVFRDGINPTKFVFYVIGLGGL